MAVSLTKNPRAGFITEPFAHRFRAKSPNRGPIAHRIMAFLTGLLRRMLGRVLSE